MVGELTQNEIGDILTNTSIGRIGCTDGVRVYIVPMLFRLEENAIVCFSLEGLKIEMMRQHPSVCFEVDRIKDAEHWKCVIINGVFEEITDKNELDELRPRYTEYFLRKRATLTSAIQTEGTLNIDLSDSLQVFFRIRFKDITGRSAIGL
jgi:nitroimidazol reductase NimA-like FMN-containing flavoprotein (pyridoxamine 5'-phosphate oxidase superfamily)